MSNPTVRVGIIAALPGELAPLVKGWTPVPAAKNIHHWERDAGQSNGQPAQWVAVCAGIGRDAATRAFAAAEKDGPLNAVLSIGWAGGLAAEAPAGLAFETGWVLDSKTGERFELHSNAGVGVVTTARVADPDEKARLAAAYPAAVLVDMEAATVARLAAIRGIPMYCFKAVSDGVGDRLPDLNPFIDAQGQFHTARFVSRALLRPRYWAALKDFGRNSRKGAVALGEAVASFLEQEKYLR